MCRSTRNTLLSAAACVGFFATWMIPAFTQLLFMAAVGIDVAEVHDLTTGEEHSSTAYSAVALATFAFAFPCTAVLVHWLASTELGHVAATPHERRSTIAGRARAHPFVCLTLSLIAGVVHLGVVVAPFEQLEESANREAAVSLAVASGLDAELASCLAEHLDDAFELSEGIEMTPESAETIFHTSLECRRIIDPGETDCLFDELLAAADPGRWRHPADALLPFERGTLDPQDVERASIRCGAADA